ncbi:hypothetical protein ACO0R3_002713 [Hanseniaspora guilliermondii]
MSNFNKNPQSALPSHEVPEFQGDSVYNKKPSYNKTKGLAAKKVLNVVNNSSANGKKEGHINTFSPSHQSQQMNMQPTFIPDNYHHTPNLAMQNMAYHSQPVVMGYPNNYQYNYNAHMPAVLPHQMAQMQSQQDRSPPKPVKVEKQEIPKKLNFNEHISQEVARNISVNLEFTEVFDSIKKNSEKTIVSLGELIKAAEDQIVQENKNIEKQIKSDEMGAKVAHLNKQKVDCDSKIKELDEELELLSKEEEELDRLLKEQEELFKAKEDELETKLQKSNSSPSSAGDWSSLSSVSLNKNKGKPVTIVLDSSKTSVSVEESKDEVKKPLSKTSKTKTNVKSSKQSSASSEKEVTLTPATNEGDFSAYNENENFGKKAGMFILEYMINPSKNYTFIEEKLKSFTPPKFMNTSNICFMNSILQSLLSIPEFLNLLYGISRSSDYDIDNIPICFYTWNFLYECIKVSNNYKALSSLGNVDETANVSLDTSVLFDHLVNLDKFKTLKKGRQEDAEEYLTLVLDSLNDEFISLVENLSFKDVEEFINNNIEKESDILSYLSKFLNNKKCAWLNEPSLGDSLRNKIEIFLKNQSEWEVASTEKLEIRYTEYYPTPITTIFGCLMMSELKKNKAKCKKGEYPISITYDPHLVLPLNLQKDANENEYSIKGMLEKWASEEHLEIDNNEVMKINKFHDLPKVLIIQIKRFNYHLQTDNLSVVDAYKHENKVNGKAEKLNDYIDFDFDFDIPSSCLQDPTVASHSYTLKSIVYHSGSDTHSGHYTTDSMNTKNGWFRCNDMDIHKVTKKDVLELGKKKVNTPYILFYVRN